MKQTGKFFLCHIFFFPKFSNQRACFDIVHVLAPFLLIIIRDTRPQSTKPQVEFIVLYDLALL